MVVRYGPNRFSINSSIALRDTHGMHANVQKLRAYGTFIHFFWSCGYVDDKH